MIRIGDPVGHMVEEYRTGFIAELGTGCYEGREPFVLVLTPAVYTDVHIAECVHVDLVTDLAWKSEKWRMKLVSSRAG